VSDEQSLEELEDVLAVGQQLLFQYRATYEQMMSEIPWSDMHADRETNGVSLESLVLSALD
jgi:hypothetical protein